MNPRHPKLNSISLSIDQTLRVILEKEHLIAIIGLNLNI